MVVASINDLTTRFGFGRIAEPRPVALQSFSLEDDPEGLWVAERNGDIVGFAFSWVCEDLWFLAQLFVALELQSGGLGRDLLAKTLEHAEARNARSRALITFAFNRASQGLYIARGLYPLCPLYMMSAKRDAVIDRRIPSRLRVRALELSDETLAKLASLDRAALGVSRAKHHRYMLGPGGLKGVMLWSGAECVGYAYVGTEGHIGPIAVTTAEFAAEAFAAGLSFAAEGASEQVSAFVPGSSPAVLDAAMGVGMRITMPLLLMGSGGLPVWDRYLPRNPGLM